MAKTLRVLDAPDEGWVTKPDFDDPANAVTPEELDDDFLGLWDDNAQVGTARLELAANPVHPDWLVLDGSTFDQATYPTLYARLGDSNVLPDLSGAAPHPSAEWRVRAK